MAINSILLDLGMEMRGGQRQVLYLAHALCAEPDMSTFIVCPKGSALAKAAAAQNLPLILLPGRSLVNPAVLFVLQRTVSRHAIHLVHTHDARAATMGAWLKSFKPSILLMHTRRVSYAIRPGARSKKYTQADMVVGVSQEIADGLLAGGLDKAKVRTVHSGIDPTLYTRREARNDGRFVFGAVGALTEQKGFSVLVRAMSVIQEVEDLPPWEVRIVGQGPLFGSLLEEARSLGVEHRLALLGRQPSQQILPSFDALVVPSVNGEGSSAAIKEAWAVGLPVVCSALPSNEELVQDKTNGLVVAKESPLALGAAMLRLMENPVLCERLVAAGHQSLGHFTEKHMGAAYCALYRELVPKPQACAEYGEQEQLSQEPAADTPQAKAAAEAEVPEHPAS